MGSRWFRTAWWTLVVCLVATGMLAVWAPVRAATGPRLDPELVQWPNGSEPRVQANVPYVNNDEALSRTEALESRLAALESEVARVDEAQRNYRPPTPPTPYDYSIEIAVESDRITALERRIARLTSAFEAHCSEPTAVPECKNTVVLLSLPIPVSGPPVTPPPLPVPDPDPEPEPEPPTYETRTETIPVRRTVPTPTAECVPCWIGPCPRCRGYHGFTSMGVSW